jgi:hypothetical protein
MMITRRASVVAIVGTVIAALAWSEEVERVVRAALLIVGAALVADLVLMLRRAMPTEGSSPFAPPARRREVPSLPKGLVDLQREIKLMAIDTGGRRLPLSTRLRVTARAAAEMRLRDVGLDLAEVGDEHAARGILGDGPFEYITDLAPTVAPDALLAAVEGHHGR